VRGVDGHVPVFGSVPVHAQLGLVFILYFGEHLLCDLLVCSTLVRRCFSSIVVADSDVQGHFYTSPDTVDGLCGAAVGALIGDLQPGREDILALG